MDINNIKEEKEVKTLNYKSKFYEILSSEYVMTYVILNTQHPWLPAQNIKHERRRGLAGQRERGL